MQATGTTARAETIEEALNPMLIFEGNDESSFKVINEEPTEKKIKCLKKNSKKVEYEITDKTINQVVETKSATSNLSKDRTDVDKTIKLTRILNSQDAVKESYIDSYIAEITKYSSASGGRNTEATPGNLEYIHSEDNNDTLKESDEFWAERIMILKPTGEDKSTNTAILITTLISISVVTLGIIIIKKFAIRK